MSKVTKKSTRKKNIATSQLQTRQDCDATTHLATKDPHSKA